MAREADWIEKVSVEGCVELTCNVALDGRASGKSCVSSCTAKSGCAEACSV